MRNKHITIQRWAFLQEQTEQRTGLQEHMRDYGTNSRDFGITEQIVGIMEQVISNIVLVKNGHS